MTDNDTTTGRTYSDREAWLQAAIDIFRPRFVEIGFPLPDAVRIAVGFGPTGARQENSKIMGVTLSRSCAADGVNEVWISPEDADTASMLETVLHELIHVALDNEDGHRGRFAEIATRLAFEGPMTQTPASVELAFELFTIAASLGEYPGSQVSLEGIFAQPGNAGGVGVITGGGVSSSGPKKQGTRMLKVTCQEDDCPAIGYTVRTTAKWLEIGAPKCPMGHDMH
jgi:hypothetical protein